MAQTAKLLTAQEAREMVHKIWDEAVAVATWFTERTLPDQHQRLYGVPEWHHAEDITSMPGMGTPEYFGASRFL